MKYPFEILNIFFHPYVELLLWFPEQGEKIPLKMVVRVASLGQIHVEIQ
jgi:hypothetical protein